MSSYGKCGVLILREGQVATCDGELRQVDIAEPFGMHTQIGSRASIIVSYLLCRSCGNMSQPPEWNYGGR